MAIEITQTPTTYSTGATTDDGTRIALTAVNPGSRKTYFKVEDMNIQGNSMTFMKALTKICKSSKDIEILGELINQADYNNDVHIPSLKDFANKYGIGIESLKKLLQRATQELLFHKIGTGYYMVNPHIIMCVKLTSAGYSIQELAQIRWRTITGLLTEKQLNKLIKLNQWLQLSSPLRANEFNLSLAEYFHKHRTLTKPQLEKLGVKDTPIRE